MTRNNLNILHSLKIKLVVIGGPTASGKTALAIKLATALGGEIINADSMQVYRGMDIGTNKDNLGKIKSWLFDIVEPDYNFTVAEYQKLANKVILDISKRGKLPIMVGGTGLYIDAVIKGYEIDTTPESNLRKELSDKSTVELQSELRRLGFDLTSLNNSDLNNPRRLIRIIEKLKAASGSDNSIDKPGKRHTNPNYKVLFLYPEFEKDELERRITLRVKKMLEDGLIEEVKGLLLKGYNKANKSMQSTGYKETIEYLEGKIKTKAELTEKICYAHKQYAKRQVTWFEGAGRGYNLVKVTPANIIETVKVWI